MTQTSFHFRFQSLQSSWSYPNSFSFSFSVTPDLLELPKLLFIFVFGNSRRPGVTQSSFHFPFRALQTPWSYPFIFSFSISVTPDPWSYPNSFSFSISVTPEVLELPNHLFIFHFGHSRPPGVTQSSFHFRFRSLQTSWSYTQSSFHFPFRSLHGDLLFLKIRKKPNSYELDLIIFILVHFRCSFCLHMKQ